MDREQLLRSVLALRKLVAQLKESLDTSTQWNKELSESARLAQRQVREDG
jgi:hypothetical protein